MIGSIFKWAAGIAATVIGGVVVVTLTKDPPPRPAPEKPPWVTVSFDKLGGPGAILGPIGEGGLSATDLNGGQNAWWHQFSVLIENDCPQGRVHVSNADLAVTFTVPSSTDSPEWIFATRHGAAYQPQRLQPTWLDKGDSVSAVATFLVPVSVHNPQPNSPPAYIRLAGSYPCPVYYETR